MRYAPRRALTYSESEEAFRAEARAWLEVTVPRDLPPLDSREGFPLHVAWEKMLFADRWAVQRMFCQPGRLG